MGMDVYGKKPATAQGRYFRNNIWWWRPLAYYICEVAAPELSKNCEYWDSNDGDGLDEKDSLTLADILQKQIDSGQTALWVERHMETQDETAQFYYPASVENVQDFVTFLRSCGGFAIW